MRPGYDHWFGFLLVQGVHVSRQFEIVVSGVLLVVTGVLLTMIPFWTRSVDTWSVSAIASPVCVLLSVVLTTVLMRGTPRWARAIAGGLVGAAVHLGTVPLFYDVASFEWAVVWAVGTGSIVVAAIGGMLAAASVPQTVHGRSRPHP